MPEVIKRKEAIARGLKQYFTGKPCKWGHFAPRYLTDSNCSTCAKLRRSGRPRGPRNRSPARKEAERLAARAYYEKNRAKFLERASRWRAENREKHAADKAAWVNRRRAAYRALKELGIKF